MTPAVITYEWEVVLRNERMGYGKKFRPVAVTIDNAVAVAFEELAGVRSRTRPDTAAYDTGEFACVSAIRRTEVRRTFAPHRDDLDSEGSDE